MLPRTPILAALAALFLPAVAAAELVVSASPAVVLTTEADKVETVQIDGEPAFVLTGEDPKVSQSSAALIAVLADGPYSVQAFAGGDLFKPVPVAEVGGGKHLLKGPAGPYAVIVTGGGAFQVVPVTIGDAPAPEPDPPPPGDFSELAKLSARLANELNDPIGRDLLRAAYAKAAVQIGEGSPSLAEAKALTKAARESALLSDRPVESRRTDWYGGFLAPLNEAIDKAEIETVERFRAAVEAIAEGLGTGGAQVPDVPAAAPPAPASASAAPVVPARPKPRMELRRVRTGCVGGVCTFENRWVEVAP
ncbi:hypothetical protein [Alienimonas sp. DA493]|uniref:hypothetical protein n=1 Tax=Alienimonas sp. DA493 TaxID=3373605 RepID=UPI003754160B